MLGGPACAPAGIGIIGAMELVDGVRFFCFG
jgi:hypothetical protein